LTAWLDACAAAGFDERVPLAVVREAWMTGIDGLDASRRFLTGGVVFCTSLPLRAVPFEVVCLLGMNDGDFPRVERRTDFDLMGLPGQQRPGDRSRRDDDRYLLLEALLSARRTLYVSWCGRNARDNTVQPPSVLIAQLRDYLAAGWRGEGDACVLVDRTVEHPLQPFGRRYFEAGGPITFAREWRAAHVSSVDPLPVAAAASIAADGTSLTLQRLAGFLRNPVKVFFRDRLDVKVPDEPESVDDDEPFELDGLAQYQLRKLLLDDPQDIVDRGIEESVRRRSERLERSGVLPLFERGARLVGEAAATIGPMIERWSARRAALPAAAEPRPIRFMAHGVAIDDWIDDLRTDGSTEVRLVLTPSKVLDGPHARAAGLIDAWVAMLAASATGHPLATIVIGCDATLTIAPFDPVDATVLLADLVAAWLEGTHDALPFSAKTALAAVDDHSAKDVYEGTFNGPEGERREFALRRRYPDFAALAGDGRFEAYAERLFVPLLYWARSATIEPYETPLAIDESIDA
jgi:exodeoxyribonuclease V gamma subunit